MSCEKRGVQAAAAGAKTGLGRLSSKLGNVVGNTVSSIGQATARASEVLGQGATAIGRAGDAVNYSVGRKMSGLNNALLETVDRPATLAAKAAPYLLTGAALLQGGVYAGLQGGTPAVGGMVTLRPLRQVTANLKLLRRGRQVAQLLGLNKLAVKALAEAGRERREPDQVRRYELKQGDKTVDTVRMWPSPRLTTLLNRTDLSGSHFFGQNINASTGELIQADRKGSGVWHHGRTVFATPAGTRTLTHVRSLGLPAQHYYFEQSLSDSQLANLVTGQVKAQKLPGYVGEICKEESLAPSWAVAKRALITARIYHPPQPPQWAAVKAGHPAQQPVTVRPVEVRQPERECDLNHSLTGT